MSNGVSFINQLMSKVFNYTPHIAPQNITNSSSLITYEDYDFSSDEEDGEDEKIELKF
jgi:hypothetical protein